ncbi:MAG: hypothetical protein IPG86_11450 [Chitinophagaceae bacterium]|nr:hypothetical protein [Chitinophagaceae bacterium]
MKKALIIILMGIHLAGNTEIGQLLRLPELITHYFQHHRQNEDISFLEFIAQHYGGDDGSNADDEYDSQLPCHNLNHNTISLVFSPMIADIQIDGKLYQPETDFSTRLEVNTSARHVLMILQPPRA